ncbi:MAG: hypothetical protein ACFFCQ_04020 [Promethearchaeota archaeon]
MKLDWISLIRKIAIIVIIFIFAFLLFLWNKEFSVRYFIYVGIFAIAAISLNLESGYSGLTNFGVVAFFAIGAYTTALFTLGFPVLGPKTEYTWAGVQIKNPGLEFHFLLSLMMAIVVAGIAGYLISITTLKLREDYLAIVTIAVGEILRIFFLHEDWIHPPGKGVAMGGFRGLRIENPFSAGFDIIPEITFRIFGWTIHIPRLAVRIKGDIEWTIFGWKIFFEENYFVQFAFLGLIVILLILTLIFVQALVNSPYGRIMRGLREDAVATESLGKDTVRFKSQIFVIASGIAGLAGGLYGYYNTLVNPDSFIPLLTFTIWIMMIIGGKANNYSVVLGATLITFLEQSARIMKDWREEPPFNIDESLFGIKVKLGITEIPQLDTLYKFKADINKIILTFPADILTLSIIGGLLSLGCYITYQIFQEKENLTKLKRNSFLALAFMTITIGLVTILLLIRLKIELVFTHLTEFTSPLYLSILIIPVILLGILYTGGLQRIRETYTWAETALHLVTIIPLGLYGFLLLWNIQPDIELLYFENRQLDIYLILLFSIIPLIFLIGIYISLERSSQLFFNQVRSTLLILCGITTVWFVIIITLMLPVEPNNFRLILTGALLILFVMFRPQGMIPERPLSVPYESKGDSK